MIFWVARSRFENLIHTPWKKRPQTVNHLFMKEIIFVSIFYMWYVLRGLRNGLFLDCQQTCRFFLHKRDIQAILQACLVRIGVNGTPISALPYEMFRGSFTLILTRYLECLGVVYVFFPMEWRPDVTSLDNWLVELIVVVLLICAKNRSLSVVFLKKGVSRNDYCLTKEIHLFSSEHWNKFYNHSHQGKHIFIRKNSRNLYQEFLIRVRIFEVAQRWNLIQWDGSYRCWFQFNS